MEIIANTPPQSLHAYLDYYSQLADLFFHLVMAFRPARILEVGCGKGQLTLPLLERLPERTRLVCVDSSRGPYAGWLKELEAELEKRQLRKRVHPVHSDGRNMMELNRESVDVIISNEFICDLSTKRDLEKALREFRRVLRPGGGMIHGEWISSAGKTPKDFAVNHWPAWNPDQLSNQLARYGFFDIRTTYFDSSIRFGDEAALEELRTWGASEKMIRKNRNRIMANGIRLPFEHIVRCRK